MKAFDKVSSILSELSGVENICLDSGLQDDLALDSLNMVILLMMLEERFEIVLDESDMNPFDLVTVSSVVDLVEKYIGGDSDEEEN